MHDRTSPAVTLPPARPARRRRGPGAALAAAALLLALLVGAAWLLPAVTDWTARRDDIAALSAARLGRSVTLEGPVRLALLPEPMIEAQGVTLGGEGEDIALGARALRIRLGLGALLAGRIEPREIVLIGADMRLPWPPPPFAALFLPADWAGRLDIRIEESALRLGGLALSGLAGRIAAGGGLGTVADLAFSWGGQPARLAARIAPAAPDFSAPLDLDVTVGAARLRLRGALLPEGGVEGEADALVPDLSALLPAPPVRLGGFGRLALRGEEILAERLSLDLGGAPASGSVALRLGPSPRLAVSLDAARLDLAPWLGLAERVRQAVGTATLALSAEAASLGGVELRRLRAEASAAEGGRVTIPAVSALLPGDALLTASGAGQEGRLDLSGRLVTADLRGLLAALGAPEAVLGRLPPAALRWAGLDWRAVAEAGQVALPEIAGRLDGAAVSGAATLRLGPRPALGLGLAFDRLDLGLYRPRGLGAAEALALAAGFDADLRLSAERVADGALLLERVSLDAALSQGRLLLRRAAGTLGGAQATLSGQVLPPERAGGPLRIAEFAAEAAAPAAAPLLRALLPAFGLAGAALPPIAAAPVSLRLAGGGPADALLLSLAAEIEALRVEGTPRLDLLAGGVSGPITLRHPGAARLASLLTGERGWDWLGEGSFSLVANGSAGPGRWSADAFDLVAGEARLSGALALRPDGQGVGGRIAAEVLPLPLPAPGSPAPLPFALLDAGRAEIEVSAGRVALRGGPELAEASARLSLEPGRLRLERIAARLAGGSLSGSLAFGMEGWVPRLALSLRIAGATLTQPLFGLPLDLSAGQFDVAAELTAAGYSPAGLAAGLGGELEVSAANGVLVGFDLPAAALAYGLADPAEAASGLGAALSSGATAFERLALTVAIESGRARIVSAALLAEGGISARGSGGADLSRRLLDLRVEAQVAEGVPFGVRLFGAAEAPQRLLDVSEALRRREGGGR
jgi:hypothetical protein